MPVVQGNPIKEQNSGVQKQPVVSSSTHVPIISTAVGEMSGLSPLSMGGVVYSSTPFYPRCSVPSTSMPGLVAQHLQTQQPTPVLPVVLVGNFVNRSDYLPFTAVTAFSPSTMPYVPSATQQLPISGGQAHLMPTGNSQQLSSSISDQISTDSALLKRVTIPKFFGQKKNYETWKAAFYSCVDRTKASPEYKLLRLRECLQGEALKVIEHLGHSAAAYEAAKSRLERKYGEKCRALTLCLVELDAFKLIREDNEKDLERFSELLDGIVVNLKDANQEAELGNGSLYITLQQKFNKGLLCKYKQWISDNHRIENVGTLREFVDRESEFLTTASETITGVLSGSKRERTFLAEVDPEPKKKQGNKCKLCKGSHGMWNCENFKKMPVDMRWNVAKEQKLCFRCRSNGHRGEACSRSRVCGLNGCRSHHHRMLHEDPKKQEKTKAANVAGSREVDSSSTLQVGATAEGESEERTHTTTTGARARQLEKSLPLRVVTGASGLTAWMCFTGFADAVESSSHL